MLRSIRQQFRILGHGRHDARAYTPATTSTMNTSTPTPRLTRRTVRELTPEGAYEHERYQNSKTPFLNSERKPKHTPTGGVTNLITHSLIDIY